jgi:DNA mismatch repair protein MutL
VIVENLFFKIPVRKKFLKSAATEFSHCKNSFLRTSLIHDNINWYFHSNGKEVIKLPAKKISERFANICDVSVDRINFIKKTIGPITIKVCFPFSEKEKKKKNNQFIYVNERAVTNRTILHAVGSALEEVMHGNKYLSILLSLTIPNELIDFNVHPCKTEVRFKENAAVYEAVLTTLKDSFKNYAGQEYTNEIIDLNFSKKLSPVYGRTNEVNLPIKISSSQNQLGLKSFSNYSSKTIQNTNTVDESLEQIPPLGFALAQLQGIYILAENSEGLIIVDIHAAHERILFEGYKKNIDSESLKVQKLISPILVQVSEDEMEIFTENKNLISTMGFEVIKASSKSLSLEGVPELTNNLDIQNVLTEIIEDLSKFGRAEGFESKLMKFLGNVACKSAIKANRKMTIPEMNSLLRTMEKTDYGGKCNHGRPTWAQLSLENIDKIFLRGR